MPNAETTNPSDPGLEARVTALETKMAYQDRLIQELDAQAYERLRLIERLGKRVEAMADKLKDLAVDPGEALAGRERPPHY